MAFNASAVAAAEELRLLAFTSNDAFTLGCAIRSRIQRISKGKQALISIESAHGQPLFLATSGEGVQPDNVAWANRKRNSVLRWGVSTATLNLKFKQTGIPSYFGVTEKDFAIHGGGFPLRVKGVESLVAVVVVSGLAQEDDHQVIVDSVKEFIAEQEKSQQ
ncbi:hypothetical protein JCM6882_003159 [Rhodosporidiobolus microsporus]